jgi:8-oxo-dGTP pyrophosphatase MutT (NUDIX family)
MSNEPADDQVISDLYTAAVAHVIRDGRGLLPMSRRRGVWKTVGGRTEPGETPERTMLREVQEEIGILPTLYRRLPDRTLDAHNRPALIAVFAIRSGTANRPTSLRPSIRSCAGSTRASSRASRCKMS